MGVARFELLGLLPQLLDILIDCGFLGGGQRPGDRHAGE